MNGGCRTSERSVHSNAKLNFIVSPGCRYRDVPLAWRSERRAGGIDDQDSFSAQVHPDAATRGLRLLHKDSTVLAKPTGPICNLDCEYCFFLSKESLYPGDRFRMSDELLESYVRQLFESHASAPEVTVVWQGGKPTLMGVEFFRRAIELTERYRPPGQQVQHTIQTNGTLLNDAWCELLAEHRFLVGISIDGPPSSTTATGSTSGETPRPSGCWGASSCSASTRWSSTSCAR